MDTTGGIKLLVAFTVAVVIAFTIILLTAILEPKPYNSQHTRLLDRDVMVFALAAD